MRVELEAIWRGPILFPCHRVWWISVSGKPWFERGRRMEPLKTWRDRQRRRVLKRQQRP